MALSLLQRVKDKALGLINGFSQPRQVNNPSPLFPNVVNTVRNVVESPTFKQGVENIKNTPITEFNPITSLFTKGQSDARDSFKIAGDTIQSIPDMPKIEKIQDTGNKLVDTLINAQRDKLNLGTDIVNSTVTPSVRSYGETSSKIGEQKPLNFWDALNAYDVLTPGVPEAGIAKAGMVPLAGILAKKTTKEVGEQVAEKATRDVAEKAVEIGLPDVELKTWKNNIDELLKSQKVSEKTAKFTKKAEGTAKGLFTKVKDYFIGDKNIQGSLGVIANDSPAGKAIVNTIKQADEQRALLTGKTSDQLRRALKVLSPDEKSTFADVVEGRLPAVSDAQQIAVNVWKGIAKDIHDVATSVGLKVGKIEDYFPHFMTDKGGKSLEESFFIDRGADLGYGNLKKSRTSNMPYDKNPEVLFDYIDHAFKNITHEAVFGKGDQNLYKLSEKTLNKEQVASYLDQILGKGKVGGLGEEVAKVLQGVQTVTKLNPLSSVTNLTQNLSTAMRTDIPTVTKTISEVINNPELAISRAIRSGEIGTDMKTALADFTGEGSITSKWIRLIGMGGTEKANRIIAVNSGVNFVEKLVQQAVDGSKSALRELERFGINASKVAKGLSEDDLIKAGRQISRETQFATGPGELPFGWKTTGGKVLTQFKSFAYKQTGFLKENAVRVAKEAKNGNFKPLATALVTYGVVAPIVGEVINDIRSVYKNNKRKDKGVERYVNNILSATSFGLLDNIAGLTGQYGESGVASTVAGPTVGDAYKGSKSVSDFASGIKNYDTDKSFIENVDPSLSTTRNLVKSIPAVGGTLSNTLVPNSYVDNYVGVNNGMSTKDKKTYQSLLDSGNTAKAEEFKNTHQYAETKGKGGFIENFFKKKETAKPLSEKATPEEIKKFNSEYDDLVDAGGVPTDEQIKSRLFRSEKNDKKTSNKKFSTVESVYANEDLSDEYKSAVLKASGIKPEEFEYYRIASQSETDRLSGLLEYASEEKDRDVLLSSIILNRRMIGGKSINSTAMIDRLYDEGLISKQEKSLISAIKYDSIYNKFYMDRDYEGGLSSTKIKSYIKSVNSLFKNKFKVENTKFKGDKIADLPKFEFAPKLDLSIKKTPKTKSSKKLRFS